MSIYSFDKSESQQSLKKSIIDKLIVTMNNYTPYELNILDSIIDKNKLDKLIEQQIAKDNAKQEYEKMLSKIIEQFLQKNQNRYWYNRHNDTYYEYSDNIIKPIHSDSIILEITDLIPEEYYKNKNGFRRSLLTTIQNICMINNIQLEEPTINHCRTILSKLLCNEKYIDYLLITIGYSIYSFVYIYY